MIPFKLTHIDPRLRALVNTTDKKILAHWAIDCASRVLPFFEQQFPDDKRPRIALLTLESWIDTGIFHMSVIRKASLDAHAAARDAVDDTPARSAARAAGQAVATAHVKTHALGAAQYALQALYRSTASDEHAALLEEEQEWQYARLLELQHTT